MPNMDKTGPQGAGSKTGRGMGHCGKGISLGTGRCCGMGMQRSRRKFMSLSKDDRKELLQDEVKFLKEDLEKAENELKNIEK